MDIPGEVVVAIIGLAGIIVGGLIAAFLVPRVRLNLELDRLYLAPFKKWCADFHGALDEFWSRHISGTVNRTTYSNVQIIDDWRALHEVVVDGPKWLAKIKKENEKIAIKLDNLLSIIDRVWHESEETYNVRLKDRFDIISLGKIMRGRMANDLWNARGDISRKVSNEDEKAILAYLRKRIP